MLCKSSYWWFDLQTWVLALDTDAFLHKAVLTTYADIAGTLVVVFAGPREVLWVIEGLFERGVHEIK